MKSTEIKLLKLQVLVDILIQEIDNPPHEPTEMAKDIINKSKELQDLLLPVLDSYYENSTTAQNMLSVEIVRKFDYIVEKELNKYLKFKK